jgi:uncharacterized protein YndB with AHSA1/START domain
MAERSVHHDTVVVERRYQASPERVFAAWADPKSHGNWNVPGNGWVIIESVHEFRVGGRQFSSFGPPGNPLHHSEGRFEDIVPNVHIVSAGTMHAGDRRMTTTLCTVEFLPDGEGTHLILTDQSAFYGDEKASDRSQGWGQILDKLGGVLKSA